MLFRSLDHLAKKGVKPVIAINPGTPIQVLEEIVDYIAGVLVLHVNPGFAGQKYIPYATEKIRSLKSMITARNLSTLIEVDGGGNASNVQEITEAGVDIAVMGSAVFQGSIKENIEKVYKIMK